MRGCEIGNRRFVVLVFVGEIDRLCWCDWLSILVGGFVCMRVFSPQKR